MNGFVYIYRPKIFVPKLYEHLTPILQTYPHSVFIHPNVGDVAESEAES